MSKLFFCIFMVILVISTAIFSSFLLNNFYNSQNEILTIAREACYENDVEGAKSYALKSIKSFENYSKFLFLVCDKEKILDVQSELIMLEHLVSLENPSEFSANISSILTEIELLSRSYLFNYKFLF